MITKNDRVRNALLLVLCTTVLAAPPVGAAPPASSKKGAQSTSSKAVMAEKQGANSKKKTEKKEKAPVAAADSSSGVCDDAIAKHCADVEGHFHVRKCLTAHLDKIEGPCKQRTERFKQVLDTCSAEAIATCRAPWKGGVKMFECIANQPSLSIQCKRLVESLLPAPKPTAAQKKN